MNHRFSFFQYLRQWWGPREKSALHRLAGVRGAGQAAGAVAAVQSPLAKRARDFGERAQSCRT